MTCCIWTKPLFLLKTSQVFTFIGGHVFSDRFAAQSRTVSSLWSFCLPSAMTIGLNYHSLNFFKIFHSKFGILNPRTCPQKSFLPTLTSSCPSPWFLPSFLTFFLLFYHAATFILSLPPFLFPLLPLLCSSGPSSLAVSSFPVPSLFALFFTLTPVPFSFPSLCFYRCRIEVGIDRACCLVPDGKFSSSDFIRIRSFCFSLSQYPSPR